MDNTRKEIPLLIRPAASEDISDIAYLEEITFPIPWSLESIRHDVEEIELATVIVAEWNGSFAGYMDVWQIAGEGQLNNIAVAPEYRGRGIGRKMMDYMIRWLTQDDNEEFSLEVRESNAPAIHLYEKLGFEVIGRREKYYIDNGEDALLMRKILK